MFGKNSHIQIIEEIAKGMEASGNNGAYLELGIAKGACFNKVAPHFKRYTAVDINLDCFDRVCQVMRKKGAYFHEGTTDSYFEKNKVDKFNMIFIDACHNYEHVERDFKNSWDMLKQGGLIILHDTFSPSKEFDAHCEDAYKIRGYLRENKIESVTLPFFFGLTIVRKK